MNFVNAALTAVCIALVFIGAPGDQPRTREVTFEQIKPYVSSLVCTEAPGEEVHLVNPLLSDVQQQLARRSLTDIELLTLTWKACESVLEKSVTAEAGDTGAGCSPDWRHTWDMAYLQAKDELAKVSESVKASQDYSDLLNVRIAQILCRDPGFLAPLLPELISLLNKTETPVTCTDCRSEFSRWLDQLNGRP